MKYTQSNKRQISPSLSLPPISLSSCLHVLVTHSLSLTHTSLPYLGEVTDDVRPLPVHLGEDVEDEGLHVEVKRLVIQKQLCEQTQVLTVDLQPESRSENYSFKKKIIINRALMLKQTPLHISSMTNEHRFI